jgi:death-on-curing protein
MTAEPKWLTLQMVLTIQGEQMAKFGGAEGIRDTGLLESAMAHHHPNASKFELAAAYGVAIVGNHPFVDGNKRTGLLLIHAFLYLNGWRFKPSQEDEVRTILSLASG